MAHPLSWPGRYYFYPMGNTPAVNLTRDLPPEEDANVLLLGCGDTRHVLYTIYSETEASLRKLDFTCCDFEPGVLARNVLLFTLVVDKVPATTSWNIFYHMYLDNDSHTVLIDQCKKLLGFSETMSAWRTSAYGKLLSMSTDYTLSEVRRHWALYAAVPDLPPERVKSVRTAFDQRFKQKETGQWMTSTRAAGPTAVQAIKASSDQVMNYWRTGIASSEPKQRATATLLNPTFMYSLSGEGCAVHYGSDPMAGFHFAALFGNAKSRVEPTHMVKAVKTQFGQWCAAYEASVSSFSHPPCIRFCVAEATAVCRALRAFSVSGALSIGIPVAQWKTTPLKLSRETYITDNAPTSFNVIETSNMIDHAGLLNLLIAAVPLLSPAPSSVLYTETLLYRGEDATKEFSELLHADIGTLGLLLDLCPVDYLCGFTSRSNTHEIILYKVITKTGNIQGPGQFHNVTTWKSPSSGDSRLSLHSVSRRIPPVFDAHQLGTLLYDIYEDIFKEEDAMTFLQRHKGPNILRAIGSSNLIHYMRETFVLLLKLVRQRLDIADEPWGAVMSRFMELENVQWELTIASRRMDSVNYNDLCAQLHRHGVYTVPPYIHDPLPRIGRFAQWASVPPIVRIVFSVPRAVVTAFEGMIEKVGTPPMHCDLRGMSAHNIFNAVQVAWGRVVASGTKREPRVVFEEDPDGARGSASLVVSFVAPSWLLTTMESPENIWVNLSVRSTPATAPLISKLGLSLTVFTARFMDEDVVHVLPEHPLPSPQNKPLPTSLSSLGSTLSLQIGEQDTVVVALDEQCELVSTLTAKVSITDDTVKTEFGANGAVPEISQMTPCTMRLVVAGRHQDIVYPFPVVGSNYKLRLARKSLYIEVVVPMAGPFLKPDGMKLNPYPVIGSGKALHSSNIHRISLSRLPLLDKNAQKIGEWMNPHFGSTLSSRERSMRKKRKEDALLFVKETIGIIFARTTGFQGGAPLRVVSLRDEATNNCDTLFFLAAVRFDLAAHTLVCDGYVLPLTHAIMPEVVRAGFGALVNGRDTFVVRAFSGEMEAWKQLIPAFVERCRTWAHTEDCEYRAQGEVPRTQEMEHDPLCSCGRGRDVEGMRAVEAWRPFAPFVTRIALSPLFAVSYLETVGRDPAAHRCLLCREKGKPKLMECKGCKKARYCSTACQKKDWRSHKPRCKP